VSNLGELPEQAQSNLGTLTDLRIQLQNTASNLSRNQQQRISLESMLSGNLARLQSDRIALRSHFTPRHPEVLKKDQEIEGAQTLLARLNGNTTLDSYRLPDDPMFAQLKGQVEANLADSENLSKEHQRLRADIAQYQNRLQLTPVREQQLSGILRDHDLYRQDYADLLKNQLRSQLTTTLEEQQEGRRFRLVDPPTLPTVPSSPNRRKISLGAAAAGIVLGAALALLRGKWHRSFHTEKEVRQQFAVPLVIGVPLLRTSDEERRRRWKTALEWAAGSAMILVMLAAEAYVYRNF
jgi:uncharacterized protein involved in exopolysaccharide biosynthesis